MIENLPFESLSKPELDDLIFQTSENIHAMLTIITGEGVENFLRYSDVVQVDYLCAISQQSNILKKAIRERYKL